MNTLISLISLVAILCAGTGPAVQEQGQLPVGQFELSYKDGEVTGRANEAPVADILAKLEEFGVSFNTHKGAIGTATFDVANKPLENFLDPLLDSHVVAWKRKNGALSPVVTIFEGEGQPSGMPRSAPPPPPQEPENVVPPKPEEVESSMPAGPGRERSSRSSFRRSPRGNSRFSSSGRPSHNFEETERAAEGMIPPGIGPVSE